MKKLLINIILLSACALAGCADGSASEPDGLLDCQTSADCPEGTSCQLGLCVAGEAGNTEEIAFYVEPASSLSAEEGPNWTQAQSYASGTTIDTLSTRPMVVLQGRVLLDNEEGAIPMQATLYLTAQDGLPGRRVRKSVQSAEDGTFAAALPQGAYSLTIRPDRGDIPDRTYQLDEINPSLRQEFLLPAITDYVRWQGRIVRLDDDNVTRPVARATVFAVSTENGTQSTVALSGDDGRFSVFVDPDAGPYRFQVRASEESENDAITLPVPSATFAPLEPQVEYIDDIGIATIPGGDLVVGQFFATRSLSGRVVNAEGVGVGDVNVVATSVVDNEGLPSAGPLLERLSFTSLTQTGPGGAFTLTVLPDLDYRIVATKLDDQVRLAPSLTIDSGNLDPIGPNEELVLQLEAASPQRIIVQDSQGNPYEGRALVEGQLLTFVETPIADYQLPDDLTRRSVDVEGDHDTTLPLFPGRWQFTVEDQQGLRPRTRSFTSVARAQQSITLRFAEGGVLAGSITDSDGEPLASARVEVWTFDEGGSFLIETVLTDDAGRFRCRVPLRD